MVTFALLVLAASLALISLGGGLYEFLVIDPTWPKRPEMIRPDRGGVSRKRFWIPARILFELLLIASLAVAWSDEMVRFWLLIALASHAVMRIWSAFFFIPRALAFERARPGDVTETAAPRMDAAEPVAPAAGRHHLRFNAYGLRQGSCMRGERGLRPA